jgi:hypothetical protein
MTAETLKARDALWPLMSEQERHAYVRGVAHTFADVFTIIGELFADRDAEPDLHTAREQLSARWNELTVAFTEAGVLQ